MFNCIYIYNKNKNFRLHFYERKNDRYTVQQLIKEIVDHYEHGFLKQIHVVVLGLDVLGNPYTLIRGVAHGVQTFFYEPYQVDLIKYIFNLK
jgi:vacuolar protein sorting-associated protein 13A/C